MTEQGAVVQEDPTKAAREELVIAWWRLVVASCFVAMPLISLAPGVAHTLAYDVAPQFVLYFGLVGCVAAILVFEGYAVASLARAMVHLDKAKGLL